MAFKAIKTPKKCIILPAIELSQIEGLLSSDWSYTLQTLTSCTIAHEVKDETKVPDDCFVLKSVFLCIFQPQIGL